MSQRKAHRIGSKSSHPPAPFVRVRAGTFQIPPIGDGAVVGRMAPVSLDALKKTLRLMSPEPFATIRVRDNKVGSIFVRKAILRKIDRMALQKIVLQSIKPLMTKTEILALHIEIEVGLGENL